jgi:hypothetical protein
VIAISQKQQFLPLSLEYCPFSYSQKQKLSQGSKKHALSHHNQPEPVYKLVSFSQGHAFTETQGKQPGFDYLQPTELDFCRNKCFSQLISTTPQL